VTEKGIELEDRRRTGGGPVEDMGRTGGGQGEDRWRTGEDSWRTGGGWRVKEGVRGLVRGRKC
jgi:hypothetical protein